MRTELATPETSANDTPFFFLAAKCTGKPNFLGLAGWPTFSLAGILRFQDLNGC